MLQKRSSVQGAATSQPRRQPCPALARRLHAARRTDLSHHAHRQLTTAAAAAAGGAAASGGGGSGQGTSMVATVCSLTAVIMGCGYVSIPFAFAQGGWATMGLLWCLGAMFCWTGVGVLACIDKMAAAGAGSSGSDRKQCSTAEVMPSQAGYEDVAAAAFGARARNAVSVLMCAELLGISCVYVVLQADALAGLLANTALGASLAALGPAAYGLLASGLLAPTVLLPDLEALSALGVVGVVAATTMGLVLLVLLLAGGGPAVGAAPTQLLGASLPSTLGLLAFVYAGAATFPVLTRGMTNPTPQRAARAVAAGYLATAVICSLLSLGYAIFGPSVAPVVTASLAPGSMAALVCGVLAAATPLCVFALTLEPVALALQGTLIAVRSGGSTGASGGVLPYPLRAAVRLGLALACCAVACCLPYVADLAGLVGAGLTMTVSLILPGLMHATLHWNEQPAWGLALDAAAVALGLVCTYCGATAAAASLQAKLAAAAAAASGAAA